VTDSGLIVGQSGTGSLTVNGGAVNTSGAAALGAYAGGIGTASVSNGGAWSVSQSLAVGGAGHGSLTIGSGSTVSAATVSVGSAGTASLSGGTLSTANTTIQSGGSLAGNGTVAGSLVNNGAITASGGLLTLAGAVSGSGTLTIAAGAELDVGATSAGETIAFAADAEELVDRDVGAVGATITGFAIGDRIDLTSVAFTPGATATISAGLVTVVSGAGTETLDLAGIANGTEFSLSEDASGTGTDLIIGFPAVAAALVQDTGISATDAITSNATLSGSGAADAVVTLAEGTTILGTTVADKIGHWAFTPTLADGAHTVTASEVDPNGGTVSAAVSFTLDTTPPAVAVALVSDTGSSATDLITKAEALTGKGDAGAVVTIAEGTVTLGTTVADTTGGWSFTPTLADGTHSVTASETDAAGNSASATLSFTLDTSAPPVTIELASDTGSSISDGITRNPTVTGKGDANALVTLTEGAVTLGTTVADATGAWRFTPVIVDGKHTITASETDVAGNTGSAAVSFTLDTTATGVAVSLASDTGVSATDRITSNPTLIGTGEALATVTLAEGANTLGSVVEDAGGHWSFTPVLADGAHTISLTEVDLAGNVNTASIAFTVDTAAPAVTAALAADTGSSSTDGVTNKASLTGTGDANTVVTLTEGIVTLGTTIADATGHWSFSPTLANGAHAIIAKETDTAGNVGAATISFTLDTVAPLVTAALANDTGRSATDRITSNASLAGTGEANALVTLTEGVATLGTVSADATGHWSFTPVLADGVHTVVASETDLAGNTGSAVLTFTLDTTAPAVTESLANDTGISATDGLTSDPTLVGTGDANAVVTLTQSGVTIGSVVADATGHWSARPGLADGTYTIIASETDAAGNASSAALTFTLDATAPAVSISNIPPTHTPTVTGSAEAGSVVRLFEGLTLLGQVTASASGSWSIATTLATGTHKLSATATDAAGNIAVTAVVTDVVAPSAPTTPDLTAATDSGISNTDNITNILAPVFTGSGADSGAIVQLFDSNGVVLGSATADAAGNWTITSSSLSPGGHTVTAKQVSGGLTSAASGPLAVTIDNVAPGAPSSPDLIAASDSGISNSDNLTNVAAGTFTGSAEVGSTVKLFDGATQVGSGVTGANGVWTVTTSALANGTHSITATATDVAGNQSGVSGALSVVIDTIAPTAPSTPKLAAGSDSGISSTDGITNITAPTFTGTAEANSTVKLFDNTTLIATTTALGNGTWSVASGTLAQGTHSILATATDAAGNTGLASGTLALVIDTTAPAAPAFTDLAAGSGSATLSGTAEANSIVSISDLGKQLGTATTTAAGTWSFIATSLSDSLHVFAATATDLAGNVSGSLGSDQLGSSKADVITSTNGNDVMLGGASADTFVFLAGFAKDVVNDFVATGSAHDIVDFRGISALNSFASVTSHAVQSGANVLITLDANDTLTLKGVALSSLTSADFSFA
jgi:T5SS/PEP-CTERM-associated repeat protein